ncbi:hypothetical protein [Occallatibacter savannae]|uniref:hypothetical protein n=1 Tax=Occallatibacter savannae TaxID=1002691 RepID=UPI0013A5BA61|nr:hypothetical protein [Occallatibacter savannae]
MLYCTFTLYEKKRLRPTSLFDMSDGYTLESFVRTLNTDFSLPAEMKKRSPDADWVDYNRARDQLREFVAAWLRSGPNTIKLFDADPSLRSAAWNAQAHLIPTATGLVRVSIATVVQGAGPLDFKAMATRQFLYFLIDPENYRLAGPCANCEHYFINNTERRRVYCSARCGHRLSSKLFNEDRRKRDRKDRLAQVERESQLWLKDKTRLTWREWIINKTTLKKNWLTRAVNNGEISEPIKGRRVIG